MPIMTVLLDVVAAVSACGQLNEKRNGTGS